MELEKHHTISEETKSIKERLDSALNNLPKGFGKPKKICLSAKAYEELEPYLVAKYLAGSFMGNYYREIKISHIFGQKESFLIHGE